MWTIVIPRSVGPTALTKTKFAHATNNRHVLYCFLTFYFWSSACNKEISYWPIQTFPTLIAIAALFRSQSNVDGKIRVMKGNGPATGVQSKLRSKPSNQGILLRDLKTLKNDLNKQFAVESIFRDEKMKGQAISKLYKKCYRSYFAESNRIFSIKMLCESPEKSKMIGLLL